MFSAHATQLILNGKKSDGLRLLEKCEQIFYKGQVEAKYSISLFMTNRIISYMELEENEKLELVLSEVDSKHEIRPLEAAYPLNFKFIFEGYAFVFLYSISISKDPQKAEHCLKRLRQSIQALKQFKVSTLFSPHWHVLKSWYFLFSGKDKQAWKSLATGCKIAESNGGRWALVEANSPNSKK